MVFELLYGATTMAAQFQNVWGYNRNLFQFDMGLAQKTQTQRQWARKEWVWLYREDIDNLVGLTKQKMNVYSQFVVYFCLSSSFDRLALSKISQGLDKVVFVIPD